MTSSMNEACQLLRARSRKTWPRRLTVMMRMASCSIGSALVQLVNKMTKKNPRRMSNQSSWAISTYQRISKQLNLLWLRFPLRKPMSQQNSRMPTSEVRMKWKKTKSSRKLWPTSKSYFPSLGESRKHLRASSRDTQTWCKLKLIISLLVNQAALNGATT